MTAPPPIRALLPPEARLLLLSAHARPDAVRAAQLAQAIKEGVDWARFLKTAYAHGVHPLAARTLLACAADLVPAREQQVLRGWLHRTLARNLQLVRALGEILSCFKAAAIPVICLKGPGLALAVYGGLEARACNDLDVIVPPQHLAQASALLLEIGFERAFLELIPATPEERAFFQRDSGYHENYLRQQDRLSVELHWSLGPGDLGEASVGDLVWARCEMVGAEGVQLPVLPPVEMLLFQARHAAKHWWNVLRHLCDFQEAARRLSAAQWETVAEEARRTGQTAAVCVSALLVREYFGMVIAGPIERLMRTRRGLHWPARLASRYLAANLREGTFRCPPILLQGMRLPGIIPWLRHLRAVGRPCMLERNWLRLPRPLWPVYYAVRPIRLAIKYGRRALGRARGQQFSF